MHDDDDGLEWTTDLLAHIWMGRKVRVFHHVDWPAGVDGEIMRIGRRTPTRGSTMRWGTCHEEDGDEEDLMLYQMPEALAAHERQMTCAPAKLPNVR